NPGGPHMCRRMKCSAVLSLMTVLAVLPFSSAAPKAVVIATDQAVTNPVYFPEIAKTISATTVTKPDKQQFFDAVKDADIVYINTHMYGPSGYKHPADRANGRAGILI